MSSPLPMGKLSIKVLEKTFLRNTGVRSKLLATPPKAGLDFAAVKLDGKYVVISADPVTGVTDYIGRYAVDVNANDVATCGSKPQFAESVVLLPEGADERYAASLASQIHHEARRLGICIVGGHTEVTPGLARPIVAMTVFSIVDEYVTSGDARAGDTIMMTKTAGLEGTAVLMGGRSPSGRRLLGKLSVVEEAAAAFATGSVRAMHDCTEGGVLGAVFEMSRASGVGFSLSEDSVDVAPETQAVCRKHSIDPLRLIASGALLLAVGPGGEGDVIKALGPICPVRRIGTFTKNGRVVTKRSGASERVWEAPEDELWRVLDRTLPAHHGLDAPSF